MTVQGTEVGAVTQHPKGRDAGPTGLLRGRLAPLTLALLGGVSGCCTGADPASDEVATGALAPLVSSTDAPRDGAALLDEATWRALPAGCEDVLEAAAARHDGTLAFAPVAGEPSLCAVLIAGTARCVDATPAINDAMRHRSPGMEVQAADGRNFERPTMPTGATAFQRGGEAAGDPSPQPSAPPAPTADALAPQPTAGDPSPQPSNRGTPTAGDPSPQPSQPAPDPSTPWSPSKTDP